MRKIKGFTLVELVVVISIVALSLAVSMPVRQNARKQAQRVICLSNIKSQYIVQMSYASASKGRFPEHSDAAPYYVRTWHDASNPDAPINRYSRVYDTYSSKGWLTNPRILLCPLLISKFKNIEAWTSGMFTSIGTKTGLPGAGQGNLFAKWNDDKPTSGQSLVGIPYAWFAAYKFSGYDDDLDHPGSGAAINFNYTCNLPGKWNGVQISEPAWPKNASECTSNKAFIAHFMDAGSDNFFDISHGGNYVTPPVDFFTIRAEENPVGYADGHVTCTKKSDIKPRATVANGGWYEYFY